MSPREIFIVGSVVFAEVVEIICKIFDSLEIQYVDVRTRNGKHGVVCTSHYYRYDVLFSCVKRLENKKIRYLNYITLKIHFRILTEGLEKASYLLSSLSENSFHVQQGDHYKILVVYVDTCLNVNYVGVLTST